jgi:hypothetical protein
MRQSAVPSSEDGNATTLQGSFIFIFALAATKLSCGPVVLAFIDAASQKKFSYEHEKEISSDTRRKY